MEISIRKPFQGMWNIIRFNWHYYALVVLIVTSLLTLQHFYNPEGIVGNVVSVFILGLTVISLIVSFYIYDLSDLYKFSWLDTLGIGTTAKIMNINAGFDETSSLLISRFEGCEIFVADFYDSTKHTEVSIKRARKAYSPFPKTQNVTTSHLPIQDSSVDAVFSILSAHEIRNEQERIVFFKELYRVLKPTGKIIVTEHLRDPANFLAYNIGFFHFHSKATWLNTFRLAGLELSKEMKITPFISSFVLEKSGTAS